MGCVGCISALAISNASWYDFCESSTTPVLENLLYLLKLINIKRWFKNYET